MSNQEYVTLESLKNNRHNLPKSDCVTSQGTFRLVGLTELELQGWRDYIDDNKGSKYNDVAIMMYGCRDEKGERFLKDSDLLWLIELGAAVTQKVIRSIYKLSGIGADADAEILKNFEDRLKDLESELRRTSDHQKVSLSDGLEPMNSES